MLGCATEWLGAAYLWVVALHVIFVVFLMAGLLMMPRFFIYHQESEPGSAEEIRWIDREDKLRKIILNPSLVMVWILGLLLAAHGEVWSQGWFIAEQASERPQNGALAECVAQIDAYFAGTRQAFDLPLAPARSPRGAALRAAISAVPYGSTASYGQLARAHDSGARAMGQVCARNPFPIVVPCHRVTSSGNAPEKYSGGDGVRTKAWLNAHEARVSGKTLAGKILP